MSNPVSASVLYAKRVLTSLACGIPTTKYSPSGDTAILLPKSLSALAKKSSVSSIISWSNNKLDCSLVLLYTETLPFKSFAADIKTLVLFFVTATLSLNPWSVLSNNEGLVIDCEFKYTGLFSNTAHSLLYVSTHNFCCAYNS